MSNMNEFVLNLNLHLLIEIDLFAIAHMPTQCNEINQNALNSGLMVVSQCMTIKD